MRCWWPSLMVWLTLSSSHAQEVRVSVETPDHKGLPRATILLRTPDSTRIIAYGSTNAEGRFSIPIDKILSRRFLIEVRHIGFATRIKMIDTTEDGWKQVPVFILHPSVAELKEVVIKREVPVTIRIDTVVYHANSFMTPEVKNVEDLLSNMQGFAIDASGRITFNGKKVEKVMIDGEDLTGRGYQLITKNLNAQFVEKVEVVNNFSDNRLLRNVEKSDQVGINLRIKNKFLNKISGNVELGASLKKRYNAEANGFLLLEKIKLFSFLSANNVANNAAGNVGVYYEEEGAGGIEDGSDMGVGIIDIGRVARPPLNDKYTVDNGDLGGAFLSSWKQGRFAKVRAMAGLTNHTKNARSSSDIATFIDPQDSWFVRSDMTEYDQSRGLEMKIAVHADDQKKAVDDYYLEALFKKSRDQFTNIATGDITDSLTEQIGNVFSGLKIGWNATRAVRNGRVFCFVTGLDMKQMDQNFVNRSGRYASLFGLDSSYDNNHQNLDQGWIRFKMEGNWGARKKRFDYQYGVTLKSEKVEYEGTTQIFNKTSDSSVSVESWMNTIQAGIFLKGSIAVSKNGRIVVDVRPGVQRYDFNRGEDVLFAYNSSMGYVHSLSALKVFRVGITGTREVPGATMSYPGSLISGNGSVLGTMTYEGPASRYQFQTSYNSNDIYKQMNWSLNLSVALGPEQYNYFVEARPEYTVEYLRRSGGNHTAFFIFHLEKYLRLVSGKMGTKLLASQIQSMISANGVQSAATSQSYQSEVWWISGFRAPVNFEARWRTIYSFGSWSGVNGNSLWQMGWSQKMKWKIKKSLYTSVIWNANRLGPGKYFNGLDLFVTHSFSRCNISLKGHNLLNMGSTKESTVQPYSTTGAQFRLNARYLLFSVSWRW